MEVNFGGQSGITQKNYIENLKIFKGNSIMAKSIAKMIIYLVIFSSNKLADVKALRSVIKVSLQMMNSYQNEEDDIGDAYLNMSLDRP